MLVGKPPFVVSLAVGVLVANKEVAVVRPALTASDVAIVIFGVCASCLIQ